MNIPSASDLFPQYVPQSMASEPYKELSKKIEYCILNGCASQFEKRNSLCRLYQWVAANEIIDLNRNTQFQERINKILEIDGMYSDDFYLYHNEIPVTSYILKGRTRNDSRALDVFKRYDICVKKFQVLKSDVILCAWCVGNHLNINPEDKTFCFTPSVIPMTKECVLELIKTMSCVNLDSYYKLPEINRKVVNEINSIT